MTISDTVADRHYGDKVKMAMAFAGLLNQEARALEKDGVDVIQFDEPAFNVFMDEVADLGHRGAASRHRRPQVSRPPCTSATATASRPISTGRIRSAAQWTQYEKIFPALAKSKIGQVSLECINSRVPLKLMSLLEGKDVLVGVIDVASDEIETPEQVAQVIGEATKFVPKERIVACTNCGMAPMRRDIAAAKLAALGAGCALARQKFA